MSKLRMCFGRGCSEIYHMPLVDYKNHKEGMPYELKFPFRPNNSSKWPRSSSSPQTRAAGTGGTLIKAPPPDFTDRNSGVIPRSVSSDGRPLNPKRSVGSHTHRHTHERACLCFTTLTSYFCRYSPGNDNYALACSIVMGRTLHNANPPACLPYTEAVGSSHWRQKSMPDG